MKNEKNVQYVKYWYVLRRQGETIRCVCACVHAHFPGRQLQFLIRGLFYSEGWGTWEMSHQISGQKILQTEETIKGTRQAHGDKRKEAFQKERWNTGIVSLIVLFNVSLASLCHLGLPRFTQSIVLHRLSSRNLFSSQPTSSSPSVHHLTRFLHLGDWFFCSCTTILLAKFLISRSLTLLAESGSTASFVISPITLALDEVFTIICLTVNIFLTNSYFSLQLVLSLLPEYPCWALDAHTYICMRWRCYLGL